MAAFDAAYYLLNGGVAYLPRRLFEGGDADARQLRPLQLVKPEQADIASPNQVNSLQRACDLQRQAPLAEITALRIPRWPE